MNIAIAIFLVGLFAFGVGGAVMLSVFATLSILMIKIVGYILSPKKPSSAENFIGTYGELTTWNNKKKH